MTEENDIEDLLERSIQSGLTGLKARKVSLSKTGALFDFAFFYSPTLVVPICGDMVEEDGRDHVGIITSADSEIETNYTFLFPSREIECRLYEFRDCNLTSAIAIRGSGFFVGIVTANFSVYFNIFEDHNQFKIRVDQLELKIKPNSTLEN